MGSCQGEEMNLIGVILILLMGVDDWRTRETATEWFDYCCKNELLSYDVECAAARSSDLEISHRANVILSRYYYAGDPVVDLSYRKFVWEKGNWTDFLESRKARGWGICYQMRGSAITVPPMPVRGENGEFYFVRE